jgi:hypothetical protein
MFAYLTALQLPGGLRVDAAGEDSPRAVTIPLADKRVLIRTVDVAQRPANVLTQVAAIARLVRSIVLVGGEHLELFVVFGGRRGADYEQRLGLVLGE